MIEHLKTGFLFQGHVVLALLEHVKNRGYDPNQVCFTSNSEDGIIIELNRDPTPEELRAIEAVVEKQKKQQEAFELSQLQILMRKHPQHVKEFL